MSAGVVSRSVEFRAITDFLASARLQPTGLVIEGDAGIGKTTLWLAAVEQARAGGFRVLSARTGQAESVMAYAAVFDLFADVNDAVLARLPSLQRLAVDRVLLRASTDGPATDQRVVAAALVSVVEMLADDAPILLAIDDVQWLDPSSMAVITFAARRLAGAAGVLVTERSQPDGGSAVSWLQLRRPDGVDRMRLGPLSIGALHEVVSKNLGHSLPRPALIRIAEISGGNPFFAMELARAMDDQPSTVDPVLPSTLSELMRTRVGRLDNEVRDVLLAAACVSAPTLDLLAQAAGTTVDRTAELLEEPERNGIVVFDGHRVRFSHPLLAHGIYTDAGGGRRRAMHRVLAQIETQPELKARHLALAAATADSATLEALDVAADMARTRGAPAAGAELVDMARRLGGDTPQRRIRSANHHLDGGDAGQARALLEETIDELPPGSLRAQALSLLAVVRLSADSFIEAAKVLERALDEADDHPALKAQMLVQLSYALVNAGDLAVAVRRAGEAVAMATPLGQSHLLSQALSMRAFLSFMHGAGLDESSVQRALELEDPLATTPAPFRPSMHNAMLLAWTGQLGDARTQLLEVWQHCVGHGGESELMFIAMHRFLVEIWRADLDAAHKIAADAMERAVLLGGDVALSVAFTTRAALAAFAGRADDSRNDIAESLAAAARGESLRLAGWSLTTLAFLELSLGRHQAVLDALGPLLARFDATPDGAEIIVAAFAPYAAEALINLGRLDDAEPLIDRLERNGARLDRPWMLAVGARCRSMWLAAHGDIEAAVDKAYQAMHEHDRLPMPFERARTQLVLGQLQRRQRKKQAAEETLHAALHVFEEIGAPLWAERAHAELARTNVSPSRENRLTPSELRVAELAASGMTNRDVAAALFMSPKTVEHNLSRVYRKLGIRSRAELGLRMAQLAAAD
jgi:ATP/maltotriose-dependent transcriptional regulator MalT